MTKEQVKALPLGLYKVWWVSGGTSECAIGMLDNGDRWLAPTNWTKPTTEQKFWRRIWRMKRIYES